MFTPNLNDIAQDSARLFAEQTTRAFSNQELGYVATLVNAAILAAVQWNHVNSRILTAWVTLIVLVTLGRLLLTWRFKRRDTRILEATVWSRLFLTGILLSGITWGLAGVLLSPSSSDGHQIFTAFTIGGMVAGASAIYSAFRSAYLIFSIPAIVPSIVYFLTFQDKFHVGMSLMMTLFFGLMTANCFRNYRAVEASIKLRFEKQGLLEYLSQAKDRAETINVKLQAEIGERRRIEAELEKHQKHLESEVENRTCELVDRNRELQFEIKERTRIEEALRDSEERYRLLIENSIVGIILIKEQKIVFANRFVSTLSGFSNEEILKASFIDFVHPDDRDLAIDNHRRRIQGEQFQDSYPIRMLDKNKRVHWLEVSAVRLSYESMPSILVFMRDVTQQRNLESQLFQNEKMASIGQLAAGVAHEINNPVGFVNSNLHTLKDYQNDIRELVTRYKEILEKIKTLPANTAQNPILEDIRAIEILEEEVDLAYILEDSPQLIQESQEGTERIKKIVMDLKDFAHPGSQERQFIDINKCIESTLNIVWNELKYNARVIQDFGPIPEIEGYPQQLSQVFMNLLVNAAQALDKKGDIRIQTRAVNGHVEISVSDTGCGIAQENLNKIFDPFFTTKPVGKGTGLGLNVSYNIIKKHNGSIYAASEVGRGTTFTIQLPA